MKIEKHTLLVRNHEVIASEFDGQVVMLDLSFQNYFGMEVTGSRIWGLLEKQISVSDLCEQLTAEFSVSVDDCLGDVVPFLEDLAEKKLILVQ